MTSPSTAQTNFRNKLAEMFMFDQADLDFGIYRIMNAKRAEIEAFLNTKLLPDVEQIVNESLRANRSTYEVLIESAQRQQHEDRARYLRERVTNLDAAQLTNDVFVHLSTFFGRYYDKGDFISQRRINKDAYAIPYNGEEVKLHWANADQYYIKSSEYFRDYAFTLADGRSVRFKLIDADTESNNNKASGTQERRFTLLDDQPLQYPDARTLVIPFTYQHHADKQEKLNDAALEHILTTVERSWTSALTAAASNGKTIIANRLNDYTKRNTFDYFIHKNLGEFLRRELDFYVKNDMLQLPDATGEGAAQSDIELSISLARIRAFRTVGHKIIAFLAQLEDFQKKLWLKKKFVVETNYCVTIDRVPTSLYPVIIANDVQVDEWVRLFAIDQIAGDMLKTPYQRPLTAQFLAEHPFLVIDTKFFDQSFKDTLLASFDDIDAACDGLLIHSENFQALQLLQHRYCEQIKCIYIDPPYNTGSDDNFSYKDSYKSSSWLTMFSDRLSASTKLLSKQGLFACHMDEHEHLSLEWLVKSAFGEAGDMGKLIWDKRNPKGDAKGISVQHEYIHFAVPNPEHLKIDDMAFVRNKENAQEILKKARQLIQKNGRVDDSVRSQFKDWMNKQDLTGGEKAYSLIDDFGDVYQPVSMGWPNKKTAPSEYFIPLTHPRSGKSCPVPERGWRNPPQTMQDLIAKNLILFGEDETTIPRRKYLLRENITENVSSLFYMGTSDDAFFGDLGIHFENPKPIRVAVYFLGISARPKNSTILDYFAGSGTTGHAVINLNRADDGNRKYILVEMGEYFDTVTKPRIQKVIYSPDWKDGKPVSRVGSSHMFKYLRLESYEDTLNNVQLQQSEFRNQMFDEALQSPMREEYVLNYMLDVESRDSSASLLTKRAFTQPFGYVLDIASGGSVAESTPTTVDLVETFNYLIGLRVSKMRTHSDLRTVQGSTPDGKRTLVVWRDVASVDDQALWSTLHDSGYDLTAGYDLVYVNGDSTLGSRVGDSCQVRLIDAEFHERMFADTAH